MEAVDNILDAIDEEVSLEDVDMMDVEEGEVVEGEIPGRVIEGNQYEVKEEPHKENLQSAKSMNNRKKKKKKNKSKNRPKAGNPGSNAIDIDRFVLDVGRRLKERKSYLLYTAVGVLGVPALSDLVKEVDAIQACGGQKTADGYRARTGGGILWNILKVRDPNAYKEIMKKGRDFEKQFKRPTSVQAPTKSNNPPQTAAEAITSKTSTTASDGDLEIETPVEDQPVQPNPEEKRKSVRERLRVPVSYDDLVGDEPPKDEST